jgi:signal transduction histidine kinase
MKGSRMGGVPFSLILVFIVAVLVPSVALSFLALRAADRESVYVERRLEGALLAEVDLAAGRVEAAVSGLYDELLRESLEPGFDLMAWRSNPFVGVPFELRDGALLLPGAAPSEREKFMESFGGFLTGRTRLPVYEGIARVYKHEMKSYPEARPDAGRERPGQREDAPSDAPGTENSAREAKADLAAPEQQVMFEPAAAPEAPKSIQKSSAGIDRQVAGSLIASDPEAEEDAFEQASREGFEILQRNVVPQAKGIQRPAPESVPPESPDEAYGGRSNTVSRNRSFAELMAESEGGLLPRPSDDGLELLFWRRSGDAAVGCTLRMDAVRDRIAEVIPDVLSEIRLLSVLDDGGRPIVVPESEAGRDWRRPFVAREISSALPRWEVGAWLSDPAILTSRAQFARLSVWVLVAMLFLVIATGSAVIIRMLSLEMRMARQRTTFVASVSHELRTPLTSIRLFAELLLSGKQGNEEKRREYLRTVVSEAVRLSHLVDNVLAFSRRGGTNYAMRPLCLAELARNTTAQLEPHLTKSGFSITVSDDGELPVMGNAEALRQVIMNLLSNAEKYSGDTRDISVSCRREGETAILEIADRGIGVPPDIAGRIFQEFFRGDDSLSAIRSGAGLGLSIARGIARKHGGDVKYEPREGGGSAFSVSLKIITEGVTQS